MQIRTDLALEAAEKAPDMPRLTEQDVEKTQLMEGEATVTRIHIHSGAGSEALGRAPFIVSKRSPPRQPTRHPPLTGRGSSASRKWKTAACGVSSS